MKTMLTPSTDIRAILVRYCLDHRCKDCPVNTPELGAVAICDLCVVSLAIDSLPQDEVAP